MTRETPTPLLGTIKTVLPSACSDAIRDSEGNKIADGPRWWEWELLGEFDVSAIRDLPVLVSVNLPDGRKIERAWVSSYSETGGTATSLHLKSDGDPGPDWPWPQHWHPPLA